MRPGHVLELTADGNTPVGLSGEILPRKLTDRRSFKASR